MKITVPPEIERALTVRARELGTTPEVLALDSLRERFRPFGSEEKKEAPDGDGPKNLADFLRGHIGVLHSSEHITGGANMSENTGKRFADGLWKKHQAGGS